MKKLILVLIVFAAIAGGLVAYWFGRRADITIGSKHFTEQRVLGEMIAQLIEHHTDLTVKRQLGLQGTMVCFEALKEGDLDMYVEYTGTGLVNILGEGYDANLSRAEVLKYVRERFTEKYKKADLVWLDPLGFSNSYCFAMRDDHAEQLGATKISDLAAHKDILKPGFDHEFTIRPEYERFPDVYGFWFSKPVQIFAPDLMYGVLKEADVDIIDAFWTDGRIKDYGFRLLADDKDLFPPYDACILVRREVLEQYPSLRKALSMLSGKITGEQMRQLNFTVTNELRPHADVAREFLKSEGLIP